MEVGAALAFWGVSILLVVTPGADWAYAISAGLRHRTVAPALTGLLAGHVAATVAVAAGLAALLARTPAAIEVLTVMGASYLVYLGAGAVAHPAPPEEGESDLEASAGTRMLKGFGVSGLNPKLFLLFLALLPQFADPDGPWPYAAQVLVLGGIHLIGCAAVYTLVALGARRLLRARPTASLMVTRFAGVAMVGIGLVLLVEQVTGR